MACEVWVNPCLKITAHLRHMDTPFEVRWRLRNGDHIVGYERHMAAVFGAAPMDFGGGAIDSITATKTVALA